MYSKHNVSLQIEFLIQCKPIKIAVEFSLGNLTNLFYNFYEIMKSLRISKKWMKANIEMKIFARPPGSSLHEFLQARVLEWVAISFSKLVLLNFVKFLWCWNSQFLRKICHWPVSWGSYSLLGEPHLNSNPSRLIPALDCWIILNITFFFNVSYFCIYS